MIGRVVGVEQADPGGAWGGACLRIGLPDVLTKDSRLRRDVIRVFQTDVRRVVWDRQPRRAFRPKTLFLADGGRIAFESLQWTNAGLRLLTDSGIRVVGFGDASELHLQAGDPWEAYYRELAVLCPDGTAALIRIETSTGMVLTGSTGRYRTPSGGDRRKKSGGDHAIGPAWTPDAILVSPETIRTWWRFAPHEVPLSRLAPDRVVQRALTGFRWRWNRNRSVCGGAATAGGRAVGWGFGVHAHSELTFTLPPPARSFRTRAGLDGAMGAGGCARALVYLNAAKGKPLYRSDVLVGSAAAVDTGVLKLPAAGQGARRLVLVADAVGTGQPAGADPLDIRDALNWAEPVLNLDPGMLRAEMARCGTLAMPALAGWKASGPGVPIRPRWDESDRSSPRFATAVSTGGKPLTLSRRARIGEADRWLKLWVRQVGKPDVLGAVDIRVDGRPVARIPVNHTGQDLPYVVPMDPWRGKQVDLQVVYTPGSLDESIQWRALALVPRKTSVNWTPLRTVDLRSWNGAGLRSRPDGSISAYGGGRGTVGRLIDTYEVSAATDLPRITAIRLEALADTSLPNAGPGRLGPGEITRVRLSTLARQRKTLRGRYVRIEMPHGSSALHLAEVQVFSPPSDERTLLAELSKPKPPSNLISREYATAEIVAILKVPAARRDVAQRTRLRAYLDTITENIARKGTASQSSMVEDNKPAHAIDGHFGGRYVQTEAQDGPWWQVDLGAASDIDRIVVWSRVELDNSHLLRHFDVVVLDEDRREVWRRGGISDAPVPAVEVFESDARDVPIAWAVEAPDSRTIGRIFDAHTRDGWMLSRYQGQSQAAVFALEDPVDVRRTGLRVDLKQAEERWYRPLGRFRLLATADDPPSKAEPVAVVVRPLSPPSGTPSGPPPESPYALFENDDHFVPVKPADRPKVVMVSEDTHGPGRAVRVAAGGTCRLDLPRIVPIRLSPGPGEFRYLRFAFRKYGRGKVVLGLEHVNSRDNPCRYEAGLKRSDVRFACRTWTWDLPSEWIVIDRDVRRDFGRLDLTGLTVTCPDGDYVVLDHIYAARRPQDFERLTAAPSAAKTNAAARLAVVAPVVAKVLPAVVMIDADGRTLAGTLVGAGGSVVTLGREIAGAGRKVTVRLPDGRKVSGKVTGISRETDVGVISITDAGTFKGAELSSREWFDTTRIYVGFAFTDGAQAPQGHAMTIRHFNPTLIMMAEPMPSERPGGPLVDEQGRVVGIHDQRRGGRHAMYIKTHTFARDWGRLIKGEIWGKWAAGRGPMMGVKTSRAKEGCQVSYVDADSPAASAGLLAKDLVLKVDGKPVRHETEIEAVLADKDPGQHVTVTIKRGDTTFDRKIALMRRRELKRPPRK